MNRFMFLGSVMAAGMAASMPHAVAADAPVPTALAAMQPGQWQLRSLDGSAPPKTLCIGDPRVLLQIRHGNAPCNKLVLMNNATQAVVSYSCATGGNGRTTVRVETPRVIQIESQGIADKSPFDWTYEGRRVGECPGSAQTALR
jgi:hypothetical protein